MRQEAWHVRRLLGTPDSISRTQGPRSRWVYHFKTSTLSIYVKDGRVFSMGWDAHDGKGGLPD
jgi:hypothetical protein